MMEQITGLEQYKKITRETKVKFAERISNLVLFTNEIERYISLGRMYVMTYEAGVLILLDEELYYRCFFIWSKEQPFTVEKLDKPMLVRLPYKEKEDDSIGFIESKLSDCGFVLHDTSAQIVVDADGDASQYQKQFDRMHQMIARGNFSVKYATIADLEQIRFIRDADKTFSKFHFIYKSDEEWLQSVADGHIRCVYDEDGKIVAAQQFDVDEKGIQGDWISVLDDYKNNYGFGLVLAYQSLVYANEKNKSFYGWVVTTNERSIRYHQKLGYRFTGRYVKEWIFE